MSIDQSVDPRVALPGGAPETASPAPAALSRRRFLGRLGGGAALTLAAAGPRPSRGRLAPGLAEGAVVGPESPEQRRQHAYEIRHQAALFHKDGPLPEHPTNGDEERYATRLGNYSKALPHDDLGQVDPRAYAALLHALATGEAAAFDKIPLGGAPPCRTSPGSPPSPTSSRTRCSGGSRLATRRGRTSRSSCGRTSPSPPRSSRRPTAPPKPATIT